MNEAIICEQATGCRGAGDFRNWARLQGFPYLEIFDWTSSAGDWTFLVSRDNRTWYPMFQENNFPLAGFSRSINERSSFIGTGKQALEAFAVFEG